jgi:hypothetical protein
MQEKHLFEYAVIRVIPRVERGEFLNVGVILYCQPHAFLRSASEISRERLSALGGDAGLPEIEDHLRAIEKICGGGSGSGPIGKLARGERFRWLTAPRSTIVQTSPVHSGLCIDPAETLNSLIEKLVR